MIFKQQNMLQNNMYNLYFISKSSKLFEFYIKLNVLWCGTNYKIAGQFPNKRRMHIQIPNPTKRCINSLQIKRENEAQGLPCNHANKRFTISA